MSGTSCVVVAFHDPVGLERLLRGLAHEDLDVVVVNVESDPEVGTVAARHPVRELPIAGNPGYAAAVNAGASACRAPVVVFMNDDLETDAAAVLALAGVVARGEAQVAVPAVQTSSGALERTIAAVPTPRSLAVEWALLPDQPVPFLAGRLRVEKWRSPAGPEAVEAASAVIVATTARLLQDVPLPEQYFLYWEESEWFWRLRRAGVVVQYRPEISVRHLGGRGDVRPEKCLLLSRNAVRCVRRTQGRAAAALAVPVVLAWNVRLTTVALVRAAARRPGAGATLRARFAGLRGSLAGFSEAVRAV